MLAQNMLVNYMLVKYTLDNAIEIYKLLSTLTYARAHTDSLLLIAIIQYT